MALDRQWLATESMPARRGTVRAPSTSQGTMFGEWRGLWTIVRQAWSRGTRPWFAVSVATATAIIYALAENHSLSAFLWRAGGVSAALPIKLELARLPLSLFLATPYLPVWAACAQILAVFGIGEFVLGRRLTIVLAVVGHFGATLVGRVVLDAIHTSVFGLTPALARVLDTGPSAATTAVGACLLVVARMNRSAALLGAALIGAYLVAPGVDGVEHLVALACGLGAGALCRVVASRFAGWSLWPWRRISRVVRLARRLPST